MSAIATSSPLNTILTNLGREIAEARDLAMSLECVVEALGRHADPAEQIECQVADLLTQRLHGLALYVQGLAATPAQVRLDARPAASALPLADQAKRLAGHDSVDPGDDVTWFVD